MKAMIRCNQRWKNHHTGHIYKVEMIDGLYVHLYNETLNVSSKFHRSNILNKANFEEVVDLAINDDLTAELKALYDAVAQADTASALTNGTPYQQTLVKTAREIGAKHGFFDYWQGRK